MYNVEISTCFYSNYYCISPYKGFQNYVTYDCKCVAPVLFKPISLQMLLTKRCILFCNKKNFKIRHASQIWEIDKERESEREMLIQLIQCCLRVKQTKMIKKGTLPGKRHNVGSRRACSLCKPAAHRLLRVGCSLSHQTGSLLSGGLYPCVTGQIYQQSIE